MILRGFVDVHYGAVSEGFEFRLLCFAMNDYPDSKPVKAK
jgi:hypothetical protein